MGREAGRGCEECLYAAGSARGPSPASGPDWSGRRKKRTVVPTSPHPGLDKATRSLNSGRADAPPLTGTHRALPSLPLSPPLPAGPQDGDPALHPTWPAAFREGMEVIHSGNCECPFPGRGCAWEVPVASLKRPRPPSRPGRTAQPDPGGPGTPSGGGRGRCDALARVSPPPAVAPGAPEVPRLPAPPSSLLQPDFLFAASRPRLTSRAGKPPKAASFSETPRPLGSASCSPESRPRPGSPRRAVAAGSRRRWRASGRDRPAPLPSTRGRCAAAGLLPHRGRRHPARHGVSPSWPWGPPGRSGEGAAGREFSDSLCRAELSPAPGPPSRGSKLEKAQSDAFP